MKKLTALGDRLLVRTLGAGDADALCVASHSYYEYRCFYASGRGYMKRRRCTVYETPCPTTCGSWATLGPCWEA